MKHPHSSQVLNVINNFKSVLPMATRKDHLNMNECRVYLRGRCKEVHACGTVHCHAGWYAIAKNLHLNGGDWTPYTEGMVALIKDLGFDTEGDIVYWVHENIEIWGNIWGGYMFSDKDAFKSDTRPKGALNLQHIIDHWTEVYERLVALENENAVVKPEQKPQPEVKVIHHYVRVDEPIKTEAEKLITSN